MFDCLEQPWSLLGAAAAVLVIVWVFGAVLPEKKRWWQWIFPVLLAGAAFGLDTLVETDTEKIKSVIQTVAKAVEQENVAEIEPFISEKYRDSFHANKEHFISHCKARLNEPLIAESITRIRKIEQSSPKANVLFTTRLLFEEQSYIYHMYKREALLKIEMDLQKELANRWLIRRVEILEIDLQPAKWRHLYR